MATTTTTIEFQTAGRWYHLDLCRDTHYVDQTTGRVSSRTMTVVRRGRVGAPRRTLMFCAPWDGWTLQAPSLFVLPGHTSEQSRAVVLAAQESLRNDSLDRCPEGC